MSDLQNTLSELGLGKNKGKVYLALLSVGTGTNQEIAKRAKLPRTTTFEILDQLASRGLTSYVTKSKTRIYHAENPSKLKVLLDEKQQLLADALPELNSLQNVSGARPKVRFYEGIEGVKSVFMDTLTASDKKLLGILSMKDLYEIPGKEFMDMYVARRVREDFKLKVIRTKSKEVEETWPSSISEGRELRYAPEHTTFPMTIYMYDKKVAMIGTLKENFGMIIESEDFYQTQRQLFESLWKVSEPQDHRRYLA